MVNSIKDWTLEALTAAFRFPVDLCIQLPFDFLTVYFRDYTPYSWKMKHNWLACRGYCTDGRIVCKPSERYYHRYLMKILCPFSFDYRSSRCMKYEIKKRKKK